MLVVEVLAYRTCLKNGDNFPENEKIFGEFED